MDQPPPHCISLNPLSPEEEKVILMESGSEDLRRLRQMKPLVLHDHENSTTTGLAKDHENETDETASFPLQHKRRRHKAYRQSSNISLYEELANSIEDQHHDATDADLPQLCSSMPASQEEEGEEEHRSLKTYFAACIHFFYF